MSGSPVPPPIPDKGSVVQAPVGGASLPPRARPPDPPIINPVTPPPSPPYLRKTAENRNLLSKDHAVAEVIALKELSQKQDDLPALIRFVHGYYGKTSRYSVSAGDCFLVNFLMSTRVLTIKDVAGREYTVPLSSAIKFGLLCEDNAGPKTISNILARKSLPHTMCALNNGEDKKGKIAINEGDVLTVNDRKQKTLHCHNLTTKSDVLLRKGFVGKFTLESAKIKMYPHDIVNYLPSVFPCAAIMYSNHDSTEVELCSYFLSEKSVTLTGCRTDISVVATETSASDSNLVRLPLTGNLGKLMVEVLAVNDKQPLYEDTQKLLESFDPAAGIIYADMDSDKTFDIQRTFYRELRPNHKSVGVELLTSKSLCLENKTSDSAVYEVIDERFCSFAGGKQSAPFSSAATDTSTNGAHMTNMCSTRPDEVIYTPLQPPSLGPGYRPLGPKPRVKPRKSSSFKSPVAISPVTKTSGPSAASVDSYGYSTIESDCSHHVRSQSDTQCQTGLKPTPTPTSLLTNPSTSQEKAKFNGAQQSRKPPPPLCPKPPREYITLHRHPFPTPTVSSKDYSIDASVALPAPQLAIRHKDEQLQEENKAFLMKMNPSQVM